ncbi:MAG: helix-turn-helix domain-containing protein [Alphaproteobacteria bacterium]|nr:helix-turn-helix domain-containing protein [Alphaproteobacteria bacterium]
MITPSQIRAARAHLDLSQDEVASKCGITKYTLSNIERGANDPSGRSLELIKSFFERSGIRFTADNGIRYLEQDVICLEGSDGFRYFMEDVYETLSKKPGTYCVSNVDENNWVKWLGAEEARVLCDKIANIENIRAHILVKEGDNFTFAEHAEYRYLPGDLFYDNTSFYVYGDKLALIHFDPDNVTVRLLSNRYFSAGFKLMFYRFWDTVARKVTPATETATRKQA